LLKAIQEFSLKVSAICGSTRQLNKGPTSRRASSDLDVPQFGTRRVEFCHLTYVLSVVYPDSQIHKQIV